jgi:arylsulfatase A-like enzyme
VPRRQQDRGLVPVSVRSRFNIVVVLGVLFAGLVFHDVSIYRIRIILDRESLAYLVGRLPGNPVLYAAAAVLAVAVLLTVMWFVNRRIPSEKGRLWNGRLVTIPLALVFLAAGGLVLWMNPRYPAPQEWSGLAAAVIGISMLIFASMASRRALATGHVVLAVAVCLALLLPRMVPAHREKSKALDRFMNAAMEDLDRREQSWNLVNPEEVLFDAGSRAKLNQVYRFDEQLDDVTGMQASKPGDGRGILFQIPDDGQFVSAGSQALRSEISGRKQVFPNYRAGAVLRNDKPLNLSWSVIGAFQITMTVSSGRYFQLYWGEQPGDEKNGIRIPLGPPGESASYVIREKIIKYRGEGGVKHVWIVPSDENARVEIESFCIVDRPHAVLQGLPFKAGYENVGDEIRRVLFVSTPSRLTYTVEVPRRLPRLSFGISTLDGGVPTTFEVTVARGGRAQTVFSADWQDDASWSDHELDLSRWAGETVDISFSTQAPSPSLGLWSNPVLLGPAAPTPNVVIYLVDCMRAENLGAYGYERNTSPVFDSVSTRGTLYERAFSNGPKTKLSVPSLFSSNPVAATGVRYQPDVLPDAFPTLAEILRAMGYVTTAFTTNGNAGPYSGTHQGFSTLFNGQRITRAAGPDYTVADAEILIGDFMHGWIRKNAGRNFFMYIHTMDVHGAYDPPEPYRRFYEELDSGTPVKRNRIYDPKWMITPTAQGREALYDGEIAYSDFHFGRFIHMLEDADVLDNTVIIVLADHGEYFGEHRMWGHNSPCFIQGTHIPLLMVGPGIPRGVRVGANVQILDVLPTILDVVGLNPDPVLFQGRSVIPGNDGSLPAAFDTRTIFVEGAHPAETAFYCGDYHVMPEKNLIFDVSRDPHEKNYLNEFALDLGLKSKGRKLSKKYNRTYVALNEILTPVGGDVLEVDPETLKQLRALGYIQ